MNLLRRCVIAIGLAAMGIGLQINLVSGPALAQSEEQVDQAYSTKTNEIDPALEKYLAIGQKKAGKSNLVANYEEGSLWGEGSRLNFPFDELPAPEFNLGDIIVVQIKENFRSQEDIRLENTNDSEVSIDMTGLVNNDIDRKLFGSSNGATDYLKTGFNGTDDYKGETRGKRTSQLTIDIACTITKLLPDGRMMIEGRQSRIIGRDRKTRIMSGIVHPEDIDPDTKTISSSKVADSQLRWEGKGPGENVANPGLIHRILDYIPIF